MRLGEELEVCEPVKRKLEYPEHLSISGVQSLNPVFQASMFPFQEGSPCSGQYYFSLSGFLHHHHTDSFHGNKILISIKFCKMSQYL